MIAMACNLSKCTLISLLCLFVMNSQVLVIHGLQQVPCLYIFGDSLFDPGNNNELTTTAKVNYPPYGFDYPGQVATGRYSNGFNIGDYFAEFLGFKKPIPPHANTTDSDGEKGVNYASGGSGILNETGKNLGRVIPLDVQLLNHKERISRENQTLIGKNLSSCLYCLNSGNNDYIQNYFGNGSLSRNQFTPDEFADILIRKYSLQIKTLYYRYGARKFVVFDLLPSGCTPQLILMYGTNGSACAVFINDAVKLFNNKLKTLIQELNTKLPHAVLCYIDAYAYVDLSAEGIRILSIPCCPINTAGLCIRDGIPCKFRFLYAFWDGFHPTAIVAKYIATQSYQELERCLETTL